MHLGNPFRSHSKDRWTTASERAWIVVGSGTEVHTERQTHGSVPRCLRITLVLQWGRRVFVAEHTLHDAGAPGGEHGMMKDHAIIPVRPQRRLR